MRDLSLGVFSGRYVYPIYRRLSVYEKIFLYPLNQEIFHCFCIEGLFKSRRTNEGRFAVFLSAIGRQKSMFYPMQTNNSPTHSSLVSNNTCVDSQSFLRFSEVSYLLLSALSKLSEKPRVEKCMYRIFHEF